VRDDDDVEILMLVVGRALSLRFFNFYPHSLSFWTHQQPVDEDAAHGEVARPKMSSKRNERKKKNRADDWLAPSSSFVEKKEIKMRKNSEISSEEKKENIEPASRSSFALKMLKRYHSDTLDDKELTDVDPVPVKRRSVDLPLQGQWRSAVQSHQMSAMAMVPPTAPAPSAGTAAPIALLTAEDWYVVHFRVETMNSSGVFARRSRGR